MSKIKPLLQLQATGLSANNFGHASW